MAIRDPFKITKDSAIWQKRSNHYAANKIDSSVKLGVVRDVFTDESTNDVRYAVEIVGKNNAIPVSCRLARNFGGVFNYEEFQLRGYTVTQDGTNISKNIAKSGDMVLVAFIYGDSRHGIIIGGLSHAARKPKLDSKKGPQYISEFNGVETSINEFGEYRLTFKAIPTNASKLDTYNDPLPEPEYDKEIGSSYLFMDKTGSIQLNDNATKKPQFIKIDKKGGSIDVISGQISLKLTKEAESVSLTCKILDIKAATSIHISTKDSVIENTSSIKVKSPKIAIGNQGVELLDQLSRLIDALGNVQPISPVGPCTTLLATPQWANVESIKANIKGITGSL